MAKDTLQGMRFVASAPGVDKLPVLKDSHGDFVPEVAVIGRSNVGKSSLLNLLFQSQIVKTSSTPGKTRSINLFSLEDKIAFADLPGYGYAAVSDSIRKEWGPMVQGYLQKRPGLMLVLYLFDIRRDPTDEDRELMSWLVRQNKAIVLILTKADKVSKGQIAGRARKIASAFEVENLYTLHSSSLKKEGREEILRTIYDAIEDERQDKEDSND